MSNKSFWTSLEVGDGGEEYCIDLFNYWKNSGNLKDWTKVPHYVYEHLKIGGENDFVWWFPNKTTIGVEVKSLAGQKGGRPYKTGSVEAWKDDKKTTRSGWWKATELGILKFIFFVNRYDETIYVFKSKELKAWIENNPNLYLTRCEDGNKNNPGWLVLFGWKDKDKGFFQAFKKENGTWTKIE